MLAVAITLTIIGYLMLLITGINGIRHAKLMGLGFDGYAMSSIWLWIAIYGSLNLSGTLLLISRKGMPVGTLFANGEMMPYTGLGSGQWINLAVGILICSGICIRSFVMVRNAKRMTKEARAEHAKTYSASLSLKAAIKGEDA